MRASKTIAVLFIGTAPAAFAFGAGGGVDIAAVEPLTTSCTSPLRANFAGDLFLDSRRFRPNALEKVQKLLAWAQFNVVNFEGSIVQTSKRAFPNYPYAHSMATETPRLLQENRILYVTRANNHTMDFGAAGLAETSAALAAQKISWTGAGANAAEAAVPLTLSEANVKVAVLAFAAMYPEESWATAKTAGILYPTPALLKQSIENARATHDFVVTTFHWGGELTTELRPYQSELARLAIEAGSDLVLGHHAHMAQGISIKNGTTVAWGLGNFLFSSTGSKPTMSLVLSAEFCKPLSGPKSLRTSFTPIATTTPASQSAVLPMNRDSLVKLGSNYINENLIAKNALFFLVPENSSQTWEKWQVIPAKSSTPQ